MNTHRSLVIGNAKDDLSASILALAALERLPSIHEWEDLVDRRPYAALVDDLGQLDELLAAGLDDEVRGRYPAPPRRLGCNRHEAAARTQHGRRPFEPLAACGVEHEIDVADDVLEPHRRVIDSVVGSELVHGLHAGGRRPIT